MTEDVLFSKETVKWLNRELEKKYEGRYINNEIWNYIMMYKLTEKEILSWEYKNVRDNDNRIDYLIKEKWTNTRVKSINDILNGRNIWLKQETNNIRLICKFDLVELFLKSQKLWNKTAHYYTCCYGSPNIFVFLEQKNIRHSHPFKTLLFSGHFSLLKSMNYSINPSIITKELINFNERRVLDLIDSYHSSFLIEHLWLLLDINMFHLFEKIVSLQKKWPPIPLKKYFPFFPQQCVSTPQQQFLFIHFNDWFPLSIPLYLN